MAAVFVSYEHHLKDDLSGYPKTLEPRELSVFSKIVAVANGYDAPPARPYGKGVPLEPNEVLRDMWQDESLGYDPTLVKALINLLGIYPVGTCVILDTYEIGVVHSANPDSSQLHRPIVRIVSTSEGGRLSETVLADLAAVNDQGTYERSIIQITDGERYGITPSDYFV